MNAIELTNALRPEENKDCYSFSISTKKVVTYLRDLANKLERDEAGIQSIKIDSTAEFDEFPRVTLNVCFVEKIKPHADEIALERKKSESFDMRVFSGKIPKQVAKLTLPAKMQKLANETGMPIEPPPQDFLDNIAIAESLRWNK
jgi:hypothetical protein